VVEPLVAVLVPMCIVALGVMRHQIGLASLAVRRGPPWCWIMRGAITTMMERSCPGVRHLAAVCVMVALLAVITPSLRPRFSQLPYARALHTGIASIRRAPRRRSRAEPVFTVGTNTSYDGAGPPSRCAAAIAVRPGGSPRERASPQRAEAIGLRYAPGSESKGSHQQPARGPIAIYRGRQAAVSAAGALNRTHRPPHVGVRVERANMARMERVMSPPARVGFDGSRMPPNQQAWIGTASRLQQIAARWLLLIRGRSRSKALPFLVVSVLDAPPISAMGGVVLVPAGPM